MADKRINALTTTSASVGDDYFAIDGATNGTRALSAFSPTFGGNATVTGTLTVNGTGTSKVGGILRVGDASTGLYLAEDTGGNAYVTTGVGTAATGFLVGTSSNIPLRFQINSSVVARFAPTTGNLLIGTETDISGSGGLKVAGTTASTSTSSGALVVSGGVGVAGAVNVGGNLGVTGTITVSGDQNSFFSGSWPRMFFTTNGSSVWLSGATTGASTVQHDFQNRSTTSLLALYGTGNAVFAGNIKTAAPAGGTAAEWKLGTVATVSPTSPNRTIEVDIGGTIYYIHAKTTNN